MVRDIPNSDTDELQYNGLTVDERRLQAAIYHAVVKVIRELEPTFMEKVTAELKRTGVTVTPNRKKQFTGKTDMAVMFDEDVLTVAEMTPIEQLDLPLRVYNPITKYREPRSIFTVADLYYSLESEITSYRSLGKVGIKNIRDALVQFAADVKNGGDAHDHRTTGGSSS